jgi:predicted  nucleic acid-binding Zn-ribbon protein
MNWLIYGLFLVGVGLVKIVRQRSKPLHSHRCNKCGAVWSHATSDEWRTARAWVEAHTCPACGTEQFEIEAHHASEKAPLNTGGTAQRPAVSSVAAPTADHGAGPALPTKRKPS